GLHRGGIQRRTRREGFGAVRPRAGAPDRRARFRVARIDDFRISRAAEWTTHACRSFPVDLSGTHTQLSPVSQKGWYVQVVRVERRRLTPRHRERRLTLLRDHLA